MRMKFAFGVGFGLGYYLGAMAGKERYEQINRVVRKVKSSDAFQTAEHKAKAKLTAQKAQRHAEQALYNGIALGVRVAISLTHTRTMAGAVAVLT